MRLPLIRVSLVLAAAAVVDAHPAAAQRLEQARTRRPWRCRDLAMSRRG